MQADRLISQKVFFSTSVPETAKIDASFQSFPLHKHKAVHLNERDLNAPFVAVHFALVFAFNIDSLLFQRR